MFNSIRGTVSEKTADSVRLDTGSIEWDIAMPALDLRSLPEAGETARVWVWLYHREDAMRLFGFMDEKRRSMFLDLLKIDGIGPRNALKIMGGISQSDLEQALDTEDLGRLEATPGISKKIAQKMILSLKGKLSSTKGTGSYAHPQSDLLEALLQMGYSRKSALEALSRAETMIHGSPSASEREKALLKQAIVLLSTAAT
ncbi:MAG: Holliday junction branch migration protein RuvA [Spirochaetaceae bacterium]|jgi:Holliday junction DNA helicase RuvA|nr:Holliday junction branch migration protein RuvA [Spirochaetaceae bacterium]